MAGPLEAIISAILGRQPNPGSGGSPYPTDYMDTDQRMRLMGASPQYPGSDVQAPGIAQTGQYPYRGAIVSSPQGIGGGEAGVVSDRIRAKTAARQAGLPSGELGNYAEATHRLRPESGPPAEAEGPSEAVAEAMTPEEQMEMMTPDVGPLNPPKTVEAEVVDSSEAGPKGDKLTSAPSGGGEGSTITVKKGDSLWRIATQVAGSKDPKAISAMVKQIAQANGIANPDQISVGMKIKVPEANVPTPRMRPTVAE